ADPLRRGRLRRAVRETRTRPPVRFSGRIGRVPLLRGTSPPPHPHAQEPSPTVSMSAAVELRIGCVGYSYDFWVGPFYPRHTPQSEFLKLYSKVFDLVEIDSTFYTIPPPATIRSWRDSVPDSFSYAAEFRHSSWMRPEVFDALRRREVALVWNEVQYLNTLPEITADFVYLRFIGDRSLSDLGRLQIDRTAEMEKWAARLRSVQDRVARAFVLFNNHFAGFGPACADQFRRILGLPGVDFAAIHTPEHGQKRLLEFGGPES